MNKIDKFVLKLTDNICNYIELNDKIKREELNYYLKRLIKNSIFLIVSLVIAYLLNILPETIIVFITNLLLRGRLGGVHFDNYILCLISSIILLTITGYLSSVITLNVYIILLIYVVMYGLIIKKGVIDHRNRPIKKERKDILKKLSLIILTVLLVINVVLFVENVSLSNSITFGVLISLLSLLIA